jgi:hypothetical protein
MQWEKRKTGRAGVTHVPTSRDFHLTIKMEPWFPRRPIVFIGKWITPVCGFNPAVSTSTSALVIPTEHDGFPASSRRRLGFGPAGVACRSPRIPQWARVFLKATRAAHSYQLQLICFFMVSH